MEGIDSDDSDIFVEYQSKPTVTLSLQQSRSPALTETKRNAKTSPKPVKTQLPKQSKSPGSTASKSATNPSPRPSPKKRKKSSAGSPQKSILDFFKTTRLPDKPYIAVRKDLMNNATNTTQSKQSVSPEVPRTMKRFKTPEKNLNQYANENIPAVSNQSPAKTPPNKVTLSPGTQKRPNRFKSITPEKSPAKKKLILAEKDSDSVEVIPHVPNLDPLNFMIEEVKRNQNLVKLFSNQFFESLFCQDEELIIEKYVSLAQPAQALFMKRFFGKENWHRVAEDSNAVEALSAADLITTNPTDISLLTLLTLLSKDELLRIYKKFVGSTSAKRKETVIEGLVLNARSQRSAFSLDPKSREILLRQEVVNQLGPVYKLLPKSRVTMNRVVLLFSVVHSVDEESKRAQSQRYFIGRILKGEIKFAAYEVVPVALFEARSDFMAYESALQLRVRLDEALGLKNFEKLEKVATEAKVMLEQILKDVPFTTRLTKLPSFLRRYSAGSVLASVLTNYCERHKKKTDSGTVIAILTMLLEQTHFGLRRRGKWYELLCQAYLSEKNPQGVVNILTIAKIDQSLDEVKILALQIKAQHLKKQKKFAESLALWSVDVWEEPASIEINGQALDNVQGSKLVYVQKTADGVRLSSVEEHAIAFYKSQGYTHGAHTEGFIVSTIFYTLFFDIIYSKVPGAFLSPFQDRPLDFYSGSFFTNREAAFKKILNEMLTWTVLDAAQCIEDCFAQHRNTHCVISWSESITSKTLGDIVACLGIPALKALCERFIRQPSLARSGFPDLTLWNVATKKCKFVEVKSPKDTLMPNQRVWLSYLKGAGIDCEVCNVRNVASKSTITQDSLTPGE